MIGARAGSPGPELGSSLAAIVRTWPAAARALRARGLDFCCRGEVTLAQACTDHGLDPQALLEELRAAAAEPALPAPAELSTPALIAHLVQTHHAYLRRALPWVEELTAKLVRVHGARAPGLAELQGLVAELAAAILPHIEQEEQRLFPALLAAPPPSDLPEQLDAMRAEHLHVGRLLQRLRALTDGFQAPAGACATWLACWSELARLEEDTLCHVHLENHVLAPRGTALGALEESVP